MLTQMLQACSQVECFGCCSSRVSRIVHVACSGCQRLTDARGALHAALGGRTLHASAGERRRAEVAIFVGLVVFGDVKAALACRCSWAASCWVGVPKHQNLKAPPPFSNSPRFLFEASSPVAWRVPSAPGPGAQVQCGALPAWQRNGLGAAAAAGCCSRLLAEARAADGLRGRVHGALRASRDLPMDMDPAFPGWRADASDIF